ncbi:exopolyphosphatase (PRUNE) [Vairimorpha necatrix]|uniref:Exopolyphosphatase (PRUNE) n=1 Tax=Vairimorpha necatrix TaxID=6039 RepID=A0AAX4J9L4_9MICR
MIELKESLENFFKKNIKRIQKQRLKICMGSITCDIDSFISSLVLAHAINAIFVVNMRKEVFKSKGDLIWVCEKYQINTEDLIFLERNVTPPFIEIGQFDPYLLVGNKKIYIKSKHIKLILTDHNEPIKELEHCKVEMIIDHHTTTHAISQIKKIYIDTGVGSCSTLVSRYLANDLSKKAKSGTKNFLQNKNQLCSQIASLLIIPILMDTKFLKRRVSFHDIAEYKKLKKLSRKSKSELKNEIKNINKARRNDQYQSTSIMLQKNYKSYVSIYDSFGISVIKYQFENWIDREAKNVHEYEQDKKGHGNYKLISFSRGQEVDYYIVSCRKKNVRTIIIFDYPYIETLSNELGLKKIVHKEIEYYIIDVSITRKMLIRKMLQINRKYKPWLYEYEYDY